MRTLVPTAPCCAPQLWFPVEGDMWSTQLEQSLAVGDWVANAAYFMVVSVCAPMWEEVSSGWCAHVPWTAWDAGKQSRHMP
jgi:hypothetical protein